MDAIGEPGIDTLLLLSDLGYSHLAVHDPSGRFFCSTTLSEKNFIKDLHGYADSVHGGISHHGITAFHRSDSDLAAEFQEIERQERKTGVNDHAPVGDSNRRRSGEVRGLLNRSYRRKFFIGRRFRCCYATTEGSG